MMGFGPKVLSISRNVYLCQDQKQEEGPYNTIHRDERDKKQVEASKQGAASASVEIWSLQGREWFSCGSYQMGAT